MKKIEIRRNYNNEIKLDFHDALIGNESFHYIKKQLANWKIYVFILNMYYVFIFFKNLYQQVYDTVWRSLLNNYIRYWLLIYLIPSFALGIVLPGALTSVISLHYLYVLLWGLWLGIGTGVFVFGTPYSIVVMLLIFQKNMDKRFHDKIEKKIKIVD